MLSALVSLAALAPSPRPGSGLAPAPRVVFTDCDGTMLQPDHTLSPAASAMLHTLHSRGVRVVPSTGRARAGPWTESVLAAHPVLQRGSPGVYINGCSAFTEEGQALVSTYLPEAVAERVLRWWRTSAEAAGSGLVAYVGDEALHVPGQRPVSEAALVETLGALGDSPPRAVTELPTAEVFKMIVLCGDDAAARRWRPLLPPLLAGGAALTQAIPGYLEIVPGNPHRHPPPHSNPSPSPSPNPNPKPSFAQGLALIIGALGSYFLFGFELSLTFCGGVLLVIAAIFLYGTCSPT